MIETLDPRILRALWAKTDRETDGSLSLPQHLDDAAGASGLLWDEWLPRHVRNIVAEVAGGDDAGRSLVGFLAGAHDVGKASPAFQVQGPGHLVSSCVAAGFVIDQSVRSQRSRLPHALAGQIALERWLQEFHEWDFLSRRSLGSVVGGHHGVFASGIELRHGPDRLSLLGDRQWETARHHLLEHAAQTTGIGAHLDRWRTTTWPISIQVLLTATVIVADWIASNTELFPLDSPDEDRLQTAWRSLGLPRRWQPDSSGPDIDHSLRTRFALPVTATARPMQRTAVELVDQMPHPGLLIIEAPMGEGKTEAALLAAERMAERWGLDGVFFALPSMSTSDAIFTRVLSWLDRLPGLDGPASVFLAHSKAGLNEEFRGLADLGPVHGIHDEAEGHLATAVAHSWIRGRKKGVLATFVVGTIDQVLFMALGTKHLVLRHLGLAGKVVVVDEVHAADEYMSVYLERAVQWLGAYGVPVIVMSATLPAKRRVALTAAYDRGRTGARRTRVGGAAAPSPYDDLAADRRYPLLSATTGRSPLIVTSERGDRRSIITVEPLDDDLGQLVALLVTELADGGCAVVVRNTVGRAQDTYEHLAKELGLDVSLMHARFVATDRLVNEQQLLRRFGPPGDDVDRPQRHVVVATQVVEQSLDVDFDLMVTDLAPVDLVLQRAGRLHRHDRAGRPDRLRKPRLLITGVDWTTDVPEFERGTESIYGRHALLCTLAVLDVPRRPRVSLPDDIPKLVQDAYADEIDVPPAWREVADVAQADAQASSDDKRRRATAFLITSPAEDELTGWTERGAVDSRFESKARAAVRDTRESLEVIVVQRHRDGLIRPWGSDPEGQPIPTESEPDPALARRMATSTLLLPPRLTQPWSIDATIRSLERTFFAAWQSSPWLKEQLLLVLDENCRCEIAESVLTYDQILGLRDEHRPRGEDR